jgi:hypothetical protein
LQIVVTYSEVLFQHLSRRTEENHLYVSVRITSVIVEIRTDHLPNTRLKHYPYTNLLDLKYRSPMIIRIPY